MEQSEAQWGVSVVVSDFRPGVETLTRYTGDNILHAISVLEKEMHTLKVNTMVSLSVALVTEEAVDRFPQEGK